MTVSTIGYEDAGLDAFIATLRAHGVQTLVDVRERAQSRRKGYSKTALAGALNEAGIQYRHLRALGTPPSLRKPYKLDHDFAALKRGYLAHLATQHEALDELADLARQSHVCLLCYETEPGACHRSLITDRLQELGQLDGVQHLKIGA